MAVGSTMLEDTPILFRGIGWVPYSDGPLNKDRKSILPRDGVGEENWMYIMETRVSDATAEWAKLRKEAVKVVKVADALVLIPLMVGVYNPHSHTIHL